jgi:hypothetical protein
VGVFHVPDSSSGVPLPQCNQKCHVDERDEHGHLDHGSDDARECLPGGGAEDADGDRELEVVRGNGEGAAAA